MSTAEIIAELPRLTPAELAQVQAKLSELVEPAHTSSHAQLDSAVRAYYENKTDADDDAWGAATSPQSQRAWDED